ncbi:hypothetical protein C2E20_7255 [Micractinium conductrix]|uniref:Queuosine 5'-phosphate N-glycosylase/hydrolase n=1 Tax=Micractinium conductrix TaxID=554055 RepID=A0A2P6V571_9CHLO|nr:hypothetical protein C2E20_7255 [Micractinium conductrix]|eukprot:PSC69235.1 hypothetical protein C2E20_7255 [Micractinium conductrix]
MVARETALQRVQRTCTEAVEGSPDVTIDQEAVAAAAAALPAQQEVLAACQYMRLPIRFDSLQAEVNALALFHLLDFGSGFDSMLLAKTGRDARETVQFGLLGMLMGGGDSLESHHWLREFSAYQVFQFFNIDASEDEAVPGLPGVVLTRQGPLGAFTTKLREAMAETGMVLDGSGHASLGAFILATLDAQAAGGSPPSVAALVEELAEAFPAFADTGLYRGHQVCFYRKAQLLAAQLHLRFRGSDDRFKFVDMADLSADSGNLLPAVFRRQGVVQLSEGLAVAVDAGTDLQGDERERALRAAAVVAARRVCDAARAGAAAEVGDGGTPMSGQAEEYGGTEGAPTPRINVDPVVQNVAYVYPAGEAPGSGTGSGRGHDRGAVGYDTHEGALRRGGPAGPEERVHLSGESQPEGYMKP